MARNLIYINFTNGKCIDIISDIGSAAHTPVWPNNGTILSISNNNTTKLSLIPITKKKYSANNLDFSIGNYRRDGEIIG